MYNIRQSKLELLIRAYGRDEEVSLETAPTILGVKTPVVVKAYIKAFDEWKDEYEKGSDGEPQGEEHQSEVEETPLETPPLKVKRSIFKKKKPENLDLSSYAVLIEDENGQELDEEYEIIANTNSTILIREIKPIIKEVKLNGQQIKVDLRKLRKMSPDSTFKGIKVSNLIIAAEIA